MAGKRKERAGLRYGKLVVISFSHKNIRGGLFWNCLCDCGKEASILGGSLGRNTKSCGCGMIANYFKPKHGFTVGGKPKNSIYHIWTGMKQRCNNVNAKHYHNYGGRGIKICSRWNNSFDNFLKDMGKRPKNYSLDRINNDKGYYPKNCRWATKKQQSNNTRHNRIICYNKIKYTVVEASRVFNINTETLRKRLTLGWNIKKALTFPVDKRKSTKKKLGKKNG